MRGGGEEGAEYVDLSSVDSAHSAMLGVENEGLLVLGEGGGEAAEPVFDHDGRENGLVAEEMKEERGGFERFAGVVQGGGEEGILLRHGESEARGDLAEIGVKLVDGSNAVEMLRVQIASRGHREVRLIEELGEVGEELGRVRTVFGGTLRHIGLKIAK